MERTGTSTFDPRLRLRLHRHSDRFQIVGGDQQPVCGIPGVSFPWQAGLLPSRRFPTVVFDALLLREAFVGRELFLTGHLGEGAGQPGMRYLRRVRLSRGSNQPQIRALGYVIRSSLSVSRIPVGCRSKSSITITPWTLPHGYGATRLGRHSRQPSRTAGRTSAGEAGEFVRLAEAGRPTLPMSGSR